MDNEASEEQHTVDDRKMNDSTMPPPSVSRSIRKTKSTQAASARHATQLEAIQAAKEAKKRRFGLSEWNRLVRSSKDLAQRKGKALRRDITLQELRQHNTIYDGWIALRGKVYNLSPYLPYHPGGQEILKNVLGKDATASYDRYHSWVNPEGLIGALQIGFLDIRRRGTSDDDSSESDGEEGSGAFALPRALVKK